MSDLKIERMGGLAGFGLPKSRLKSRGRCALEDLSKADQTSVAALFAGKSRRDKPGMADGFRYRITRETAKGPETVEVPEALVPAAIAACVRDEIE